MFKVANDPRITRVGHLLRRYSLDELPQLINVARHAHVARRPAAADPRTRTSTSSTGDGRGSG